MLHHPPRGQAGAGRSAQTLGLRGVTMIRSVHRRVQRGNSAVIWVALVAAILFVAWQIYLGRTIDEIGIPGVFTVKLGNRPVPIAPKPKMGTLQRGINLDGHDIAPGAPIQTPSAEDCSQLCLEDAKCKAMSWMQSNHSCWLKDEIPPSSHGPLISAVKTFH